MTVIQKTMPSNQDESYGAKVAARVPTNRKVALEKWAYEEGGPHREIRTSHLLRDAVDCHLYHNWDALPAEAKEDLEYAELEEAIQDQEAGERGLER